MLGRGRTLSSGLACKELQQPSQVALTHQSENSRLKHLKEKMRRAFPESAVFRIPPLDSGSSLLDCKYLSRGECEEKRATLDSDAPAGPCGYLDKGVESGQPSQSDKVPKTPNRGADLAFPIHITSQHL